MSNELLETAKWFLGQILKTHGTIVEIREADGVYVLKVDILSFGREDEETRHKQALVDGAFSGKLPAIVLSERTSTHYCLLIKIAGESRIAWRPLVASLRLFRSAYSRFGTIAWTPTLFTFGPQQSAATVVSGAVGYKLIESKNGRIGKHIAQFLGKDFLHRSLFLHNERLLPNPFSFATEINTQLGILRPLLGPVHGDCHAQNLFVKAGQDAVVSEVYLIDLATYQSHSLYFFDHAYLELATMPRQMDKLGERRWLEFVIALSRDVANPPLEPHERGWAKDVLGARSHLFDLVSGSYPDRMDDLKLQFLLAHVAAGLCFLHKVPRQGTGSGGLSESQYRQCFIWSAVFLYQFLHSLGRPVEQVFPGETHVPVLGKTISSEGPIPSEADWQRVKYFDDRGFNILVIPKLTEPIPTEILDLPWTLVLDFREQPPAESELHSQERTFRQTWPGEPIPDLKLLTRGGLWYFSNVRSDLSGIEPAATPAEWRRRYRRPLDDLLLQISETVSPIEVRILLLADGFALDQIRLLAESLDSVFHDGLAPIVVASQGPTPQPLDGIPTIRSTLAAAIVTLRGARAAAPVGGNSALLPRRRRGEVNLTSVPTDLLARVNRDLTVLYRSRAQIFPPDRIFGVDFRRGMPIEWAELAQNLDVRRHEPFDRYYKKIDEALRASSNHTINLLHEPSAGGTTLSRRLAWEFMERFPVVSLNQISADTASYLRDVVQFCSLPVLVLMEATVITESEREGLLQQLREDNTRAVFLWVCRAYGHRENKDFLSGKLDDDEVALFLDAYLEQVTDDTRRAALQRLSSSYELQEQRNPFFFGLTAFGENFLGIDRLIGDVVAGAPGLASRQLLSDLALVSLYSNDGFPRYDFDELCTRVNEGEWSVDKNSLFPSLHVNSC